MGPHGPGHGTSALLGLSTAPSATLSTRLLCEDCVSPQRPQGMVNRQRLSVLWMRMPMLTVRAALWPGRRQL